MTIPGHTPYDCRACSNSYLSGDATMFICGKQRKKPIKISATWNSAGLHSRQVCSGISHCHLLDLGSQSNNNDAVYLTYLKSHNLTLNSGGTKEGKHTHTPTRMHTSRLPHNFTPSHLCTAPNTQALHLSSFFRPFSSKIRSTRTSPRKPPLPPRFQIFSRRRSTTGMSKRRSSACTCRRGPHL